MGNTPGQRIAHAAFKDVPGATVNMQAFIKDILKQNDLRAFKKHAQADEKASELLDKYDLKLPTDIASVDTWVVLLNDEAVKEVYDYLKQVVAESDAQH